jgi:hypothetical protein
VGILLEAMCLASAVVLDVTLDNFDAAALWCPDSEVRSSCIEGFGAYCKPSASVSQAFVSRSWMGC